MLSRKRNDVLNTIDPSNYLWVLSTGRTGTTLLSQLLTTSNNYGFLEHQVRSSRPLNILGNLVCANRLSIHRTENFARSFLGFNKKVSSTDPLRSMFFTAEILSGSVPQTLRVIHVIRDPRDFVTSFMSWKKQSFKRSILHHAIPFWQPNPYLTGQVSFIQWCKMDKFEHFSWVWNYKNQLFHEIENNCHYRCFRFEDIFDNDQDNETLNELSEFLDIDLIGPKAGSPNKVNPSQEKFPKWRSWSKDQAKIMDKHCGELMDKHDYGNEPEWKALLNE